MIGLDTNVLLRLFIEDDEAQVRRARKFVGESTRDDCALVNSVVLSEFAWVLAKQVKKPRMEVARLVADVLSADDLEIVHRSAAERALAAYSRGKADFADYFLAEINAELGCATTVTFDRDALDAPTFSAVP
jgi:predicted nucleic-acid-binding protein